MTKPITLEQIKNIEQIVNLVNKKDIVNYFNNTFKENFTENIQLCIVKNSNPTALVVVEKLYRAIANIAEADGLKIEWGGRWRGKSRDICHFQYDTGISMAEMRRRKEKGFAIV